MDTMIYIYGINSVLELLKTQPELITRAWISPTTNQHNLIKQLKSLPIKLEEATFDQLSKLTKTTKHQGVCLLIKPLASLTLKSLIAKNVNNPNSLIWIVDQVSDPQNLGAIFRSAAQFKINGLIILSHHQAPINPVVIKVSAGGCFYVDHCLVSNLTDAIMQLKTANYWIYATSLTAQAVDLNTLSFNTPTAVVVGNEGAGVSPKLIKHSDYQMYIPMLGQLDSLNVAVASGIMMYQIRKLQNMI